MLSIISITCIFFTCNIIYIEAGVVRDTETSIKPESSDHSVEGDRPKINNNDDNDSHHISKSAPEPETQTPTQDIKGLKFKDFTTHPTTTETPTTHNIRRTNARDYESKEIDQTDVERLAKDTDVGDVEKNYNGTTAAVKLLEGDTDTRRKNRKKGTKYESISSNEDTIEETNNSFMEHEKDYDINDKLFDQFPRRVASHKKATNYIDSIMTNEEDGNPNDNVVRRTYMNDDYYNEERNNDYRVWRGNEDDPEAVEDVRISESDEKTRDVTKESEYKKGMENYSEEYDDNGSKVTVRVETGQKYAYEKSPDYREYHETKRRHGLK